MVRKTTLTDGLSFISPSITSLLLGVPVVADRIPSYEEFSEFILTDKMDEAAELAGWFAKVFKKNFYVEIQNNGLEIQKLCAEGAVDIANRLGLPLVATAR